MLHTECRLHSPMYQAHTLSLHLIICVWHRLGSAPSLCVHSTVKEQFFIFDSCRLFLVATLFVWLVFSCCHIKYFYNLKFKYRTFMAALFVLDLVSLKILRTNVCTFYICIYCSFACLVCWCMLQTKMSKKTKRNKIYRENHQEVACGAEMKTTTLEINIQKKKAEPDEKQRKTNEQKKKQNKSPLHFIIKSVRSRRFVSKLWLCENSMCVCAFAVQRPISNTPGTLRYRTWVESEAYCCSYQNRFDMSV